MNNNLNTNDSIRRCSECEKPKIYCKGVCQACYSKTQRNTEKGKERMKAYNLGAGKESQRKYRERNRANNPPKPPKPPKQNCECGKPSVAKNLCMDCYQRKKYVKKEGSVTNKMTSFMTSFDREMKIFDSKYTLRNEARKMNYTERGYKSTEARVAAIKDIQAEALGSSYLNILRYSVNEQMKCLNNIEVVSLDCLENLSRPPCIIETSNEPFYLDYSSHVIILKAYYSSNSGNYDYDGYYKNGCYVRCNYYNNYATHKISRKLLCFIRDFGVRIYYHEGEPYIESKELLGHERVIHDSLIEKYGEEIVDQYRKYINIITPQKNIDKMEETKTETKIVNNKREFGRYLIHVLGWDNVRSGLDDLIAHEAEEGCSAKESVRQGCEDYYEAELKGNEEEGYVKFNLPLEEMIDVLEEMARAGN